MKIQDYETIAAIIAGMSNNLGLREVVAKHFATELAKDNARFKADLFFKACNVTVRTEEDE